MLNLKDLFLGERSLKGKIIVAVLILTLTVANVALVGMYLGTRPVAHRSGYYPRK